MYVASLEIPNPALRYERMWPLQLLPRRLLPSCEQVKEGRKKGKHQNVRYVRLPVGSCVLPGVSARGWVY